MKTIIVASLNWGLGHATRCIPIIKALQERHFKVLLASDGQALDLLKKEFPTLESIELPSYRVQYPDIPGLFKWKMIWHLPHFIKTMQAEKKIIANLVSERSIAGIISDSRFGVRDPRVPSVYVTHQINVNTGSTSFMSSKLHQRIIKKFEACWVPDINVAALSFSGALGHLKKPSFPVHYFGIVSRMEKQNEEHSIDILAVLSGPEPQRTFLENKLNTVLKNCGKNTLMVRGIVENEQKWTEQGKFRTVNFMQTEELEKTINKSEVVISRSGYTSIMDLAILEKKAFFIPTPGQYEQEYLARRLSDLGISPFCRQNKFNLEKINQVAVYKGLKPYTYPQEDFEHLFSIFHRE